MILYADKAERLPFDDAGRETYINLVKEKCPNADILEIEKSVDYVEVEYICDGIFHEVGIYKGDIIYVETPVDPANIPYEDIIKKIDKKYQGYLVDEILTVTTTDTNFIKIEILIDGVENNLSFTLDGKWFKSKPIIASAKWFMDDLSQNAHYKKSDYNLLSPHRILEMPDVLREISGIAVIDSSNIFCVQDEIGVVFKYNLSDENISAIYRFKDVGDFEDIALLDPSVFVLRSDGSVYDFSYIDINRRPNENMIPIKSLNMEGLTFDGMSGYVYIASKDPLIGEDIYKRHIFRYMITSPTNPEPYLEIDINDIQKRFEKEYTDLSHNKIVFNPSAIAFHPVSGELYILSATDRMLLIYSDENIKTLYPLPAEIFYKPEGIDFFDNGDLLISNEGDKQGMTPGNILIFKYQ